MLQCPDSMSISMSMPPQNAESELVTVSLKPLLNLAGPAALLGLKKGARRASQSGQYLSRFKGRGMEFDEARLYQAGDDVRSIDWRVTARTGRAHTKIFKEEREQPVFICVDYRSPMAFATRGVYKSVQAAKLAALLAWSAKNQGDRIGGQIFSDQGCLELKPHHGKHAVLRFLNHLVSPGYTLKDEITLERALSRLLHHARPGSRVYIISDFRGMSELVQNHLFRLARHCEVVMIQVFDSLESELPPNGRYQFTDGTQMRLVDTADSARIHAYQQRFQRQQTNLLEMSKRIGGALLLCKTNDSPLDILRQRAAAQSEQ